MATENKLTKENVMFHLVNFSKTKWLSSEYFCENLVLPIDKTTPDGRKLLEKVQRELAIIIGELIADMKTLQDKRRIVSCGEGYKIATTPEEFQIGKKYLFSKVEDVLNRINWIDEGYKEFVHRNSDKKTEDLFIR